LLAVRPNLLLLFATSWVLLRGLREGLAIGLIGGLILDVSSAAPFGYTTLSLSLALSLAAMGEVNVFRGAWFLKYGVIAGATLLFNIVFMTLLGISGQGVPVSIGVGRILFPEMLAHILLMPATYGVIKWLVGRMSPQTVEF
jgi:rod shape-determining protein MreD